MAGEEGEKSSSNKLCKYCQKTVITPIAKCINCEGCYHTSCALRVAGLVAVGKGNQVKCCRQSGDEVMEKNEGENFAESVIKLMEAKDEIIRSRDEVILELKAKEVLLYQNIKLLEEKCEVISKQTSYVGNPDPESRTYATSLAPKSRAPPETSKQPSMSKTSTVGISKQRQNIQNNEIPQLNKRPINEKTVNAAISEALHTNKMQEIIHLDRQHSGSNNTTTNNNNGWQEVKRRSRRFVVGRNEENTEIKGIPKFTFLHVTRLPPEIKPEQLQAFLKPNFPDVKCEEHISKRPEIYSSMKVQIRQDDFRNAWKREVWPNGAIVSRFFAKKRMLPTQEDPQK